MPGIYEGTPTEQHYRQGFDKGWAEGEYHLQHYPSHVHEMIESMRADRHALRTERAYTLGYLRGYRQAVSR